MPIKILRSLFDRPRHSGLLGILLRIFRPIGEEQLFYAMSRGFSKADATAMIASGFFDFFVKELPIEYAVEMNRLVKMEMEGAVARPH